MYFLFSDFYYKRCLINKMQVLKTTTLKRTRGKISPGGAKLFVALSSHPGFPDRVKGGASIFKSVSNSPSDLLKNIQNQLWSSFKRKFVSRPVPRALIPTFPIYVVINLLPIPCVKAFLNNPSHLHAGCARCLSGSSAGGSGTVREEVGVHVCVCVCYRERKKAFLFLLCDPERPAGRKLCRAKLSFLLFYSQCKR